MIQLLTQILAGKLRTIEKMGPSFTLRSLLEKDIKGHLMACHDKGQTPRLKRGKPPIQANKVHLQGPEPEGSRQVFAPAPRARQGDTQNA